MTTPLALRCEGLSKRYKHFQLKNVHLTLQQGSVMGLVGPNGAGKSTLLRIIMGLVAPDSGHVEVLGHQMPKEQVAAKHRIGFVAEDMRLYTLMRHKSSANVPGYSAQNALHHDNSSRVDTFRVYAGMDRPRLNGSCRIRQSAGAVLAIERWPVGRFSSVTL